MLTVEIQAQNLRNKYKDHSVIRPLILYCRKHKLGFEFLKEIVHGNYGQSGVKSFNTTSMYYMKIGNNLLKQDTEFCGWRSLLDLITFAYEHVGLQKPENLLRALHAFNR